MSVNVDEKIVNEVVQNEIAAAIGRQLVDYREAVEKMVMETLTEKVDNRGNKDRYDSRSSPTRMQYLAMEAIREAVKEAMNEAVAERKGDIKELVKKQIVSGKSKLAKSLVDGLARSLDTKWYSTINIKLDSPDD